MTYEERMRLITGHANRFLEEWKRPEHLTSETAMKRLRSVAEAINKRLPASLNRDGLEEVCSDIFQAAAEAHRGKEWPDVSLFAKCAEERGQTAAQAAPVAHVFDTVDINFRRMKRGDALGDEWLFGRRAVELLERGATEEEFDAYRSGLFFGFKEVWGVEPAREKEMELRRRHDDALTLAGKPRRFGTILEAAE
jgi:hypothetical protein